MTIEIGYFFNDICGSTSNSWFGKIFTNVIYVSILISVLILLILICLYPVKKGTPIYSMFRVVFYVFVVVILIQSVHHRIIEANIEEKFGSRMNKEILSAIKGGDITTLLGAGGKIDIKPKYMKPHNDGGENSKNEGNVPNDENYEGRSEFIESDEAILNHILGSANQFKKNKSTDNVEEEGADGSKYNGNDYDGEESDSVSPRVKVSGASVEDMLAELGV